MKTIKNKHNNSQEILHSSAHSNSSAENPESSNNSVSVKLLPMIIGVALIIFCLLSGQKIPSLNTNYSLVQFFPRNHPLIAEIAKVRQTFGLEESASFFIVLEISRTKNGTWFSPEKMQQLKKVTADIQRISGIRTVLSLTNVQGANQNKDEFAIGPIYQNIPPSQWAQFTEGNSLIRGQLISHDYKTVIVLATPEKKLSPVQLNAISSKVSQIVKKNAAGTKLQIGGLPAIQAQFSTQLLRELKVYLTASVIGFGLMFFAFLGGLSSITLAFIALLVGNVLSLGLLSYLQIPFSVLLTTLPIVLSISVLSVLIHTMHRWAEVLVEVGPNITRSKRFQLSVRTLKEMFTSNLLGSLTTGLGFFALYFAEIPLIEQYGWVVALMVMLGWVLTQMILFAYMQFTRPKLRAWTMKKSTWILAVFRYKKAVFASVTVIFFVCLYLSPGLQFNGRLYNDLPANDPARKATHLIDEKMGGAVTYEVVLETRKEDFWKKRPNLMKLDSSLKQVRQVSGVGSAVSYSDFFTKNKSLTQQKIGEEFFLFSLAENNPLKNYLTEDSRSARIAVRLNDLPSDQIFEIRSKVTGILKNDFKNVRVIEAGLAVNSHTINQSVSKNLVFNFWHALVLVGFMLLFVFKSIRWAIIACLPNLIPPAVLIGTMAAFQTPVKPSVALIFSIALGLAFNNTVYIMVRLKKLIKENGLRNYLPIKRTMLQEGNPCLFETMIMLVGFSFFIMSNFEANRTLGVYMVLSIIAGALGDILFLPVLLQKYPFLLMPFGSRRANSKHDLIAEPNIAKDEESPSHKIAASIAMAITFGSLFLATPESSYAADQSVQNVLKEVQKRIAAKDDEAKVKMKIIEADGSTKELKMHIQTLSNGKFHALIRLESPAEVKGMAFLAIVGKGEENQWLYIPSSKQVRRLVGTQKSAGVLGSELTADDLNSTAIKTAKTRILKQDDKEVQIEVVPRKGTSTYSKAITTVSAKAFVPTQTEYFAKNGKVKKRVTFSNYKKVKNFWRAHSVNVENLLNRRKTNLELSEVKVDNGFSEDDFSQNSLKP